MPKFQWYPIVHILHVLSDWEKENLICTTNNSEKKGVFKNFENGWICERVNWQNLNNDFE